MGGRGVLLTLHDPNLAARFATHAALFRGDGRVDCGPAASVLDAEALGAAYGHPVTRVEALGRSVFVAA